MGNENDMKDRAPMRPEDVAQALGLLTRLPVHHAGTRGARAAWAWPVAGLAVALIAAGVAAGAMLIGLPVSGAAVLAIVAQVLATGALHEDGLADCADGFWGGWDRARRLEIMKDSRIGTYGVLALVFSVLLRWSLLSALFAAGSIWGPLITAGVLSRVPMIALMRWLPGARAGGLSSRTGRPPDRALWAGAALAMLLALLFSGFGAFIAAGLGAAAGALAGRLALHKIGGQTGDVLGASQQLAEMAALAGLVMWGGM